MPDKQNENKFMAMLERRGIVRKSDDDETAEAEDIGEQAQPEADLRSLFGSPPEEPVKTTAAPRQPVPGFTTPVMPGERKPLEQEPPPRASALAGPDLRQPITERSDRVMQESQIGRDLSWEQPEQQPTPRPVREHSVTLDPVPQVQPFNSFEPYREEPESVTEPAAAPMAEVPIYERSPEPVQSASPTERYLDIDELYEVLALRSRRTDTIYLIEEYIKSLPDSLPEESRRDIVEKIVAASGFDYDLLMGDGVLRVRMLKEYAEKFAQHTDDFVAARNYELAELEQQSLRIRKLIESRRELHKKQFFTIESEAQRLKEIITFISG